MSAILVDNTHIDALVSAATMRTFGHGYGST